MSATRQDQTSELAANGSLTYERVRDAVQRWPLSMRAALIHDLLNAMIQQIEKPRPKRNTLADAYGLLATDKPAPTDEEVERWLDEHKMEKYG